MKAKKLLLNALPLFVLGGAMAAYAAAPSGGYLPNATLDPDCAPGDTDCFVQIAVDQDPWFGSDDNDVATDNTERIYQTGNVSIGSSTSAGKLDISSESSSGAMLPNIVMRDTAGNAAALGAWSTGLGFWDASADARAGTIPDMYVTSEKVGIGTITPKDKLHIKGSQSDVYVESNNPFLKLIDQNAGSGSLTANAGMIIMDSGENIIANIGSTHAEGNTGRGISLSTGDPTVVGDGKSIRFLPDNVEAMRVTENGYVGIGTTTPAFPLTVDKSNLSIVKGGATACPAGMTMVLDSDRDGTINEGDYCALDSEFVVTSSNFCPYGFGLAIDADASSSVTPGDSCYPAYVAHVKGNVLIGNDFDFDNYQNTDTKKSLIVNNGGRNTSGTRFAVSNNEYIDIDGTYYTRSASYSSKKYVAAGVTDTGYMVGPWSSQFRNWNTDDLPFADNGTLKRISGFIATVGHGARGTGNPITENVDGVSANIYAQSGTIERARGIYATITGTESNITDAHGIFIDNFSKNYMKGSLGLGTQDPTSKLQVVGLPIHADNAAALAAGLTAGAFYHNGDGIVRVAY